MGPALTATLASDTARGMRTAASRIPAPPAPSFFSAALLALCACSHAAPRESGVSGQSFRIEEATLAQLQAAMTSAASTSRALTQHYLERIARYDKAGRRLGAFLLINP